MKKIGFIIFILALTVGLVIANVFSFGKINASDYLSFSFSKRIKGSGNVVSESRKVSEFKSVDTSGVFKVEIVAQNEFSVSVEADDNLIQYIKTEVSNGKLKIYSEKRLRSGNPILVRVTAPDIEKINASGATSIDLSDLNNSSLTVDTSGASKVTVSGETASLNVDISGASRVNAADLKAQKAVVNASGASKVSVNAVNELNIDASGASKVKYSGSPASLVKRSSGASEVNQN